MRTSINVALLANLINANKSVNAEYKQNNEDRIDWLLEPLPHGSGIDNGVKLDIERSDRNKIIFTFEYHHMNGDGYYDGWTDHTLIIKPDLIHGYNLRITGRDRNQVKDYLYDLFDNIFYLNPTEQPYDIDERMNKPKTIEQTKHEAGEHLLDEGYNAGLMGND